MQASIKRLLCWIFSAKAAGAGLAPQHLATDRGQASVVG
jgi:hypothetical protein